VCYSVVHCGVLQCGALWCVTVWCTVVCYSVLHCGVLQLCCTMLHCAQVCCSVLQCCSVAVLHTPKMSLNSSISWPEGPLVLLCCGSISSLASSVVLCCTLHCGNAMGKGCLWVLDLSAQVLLLDLSAQVLLPAQVLLLRGFSIFFFNKQL